MVDHCNCWYSKLLTRLFWCCFKHHTKFIKLDFSQLGSWEGVEGELPTLGTSKHYELDLWPSESQRIHILAHT